MRSLPALRLGRSMLLIFMGCLTSIHSLAAEQAIHPFRHDGLPKIAALAQGKPYWLVLWDLECPYCVKSMRNLAQAQKKDPGLLVVTISTDSIQEADALGKRLKETGIRGAAYAFGEESQDALRFVIDATWRGEKPRAYLYMADGQRRAFSGVLTAERIAGR
jgi:hypothetical protein